MIVQTEGYEYSLYVVADGTWKMHAWFLSEDGNYRWDRDVENVSAADPFKSTVRYLAWA